jgi:bleomycin hydrolase
MNAYFLRAAACAACCIMGLPASGAAACDASLSPQTVATLRQSFHMDDHARAMYNAVTNIEISQLALDHDIVSQHNDLFNNKIKTGAVTNQCVSGRCWLFAGLNVLRPDLMQKHKLGKVELSENYLAFWDKMEKANCFLEDIIELADRDTMDRDLQTVLTQGCLDGGWWDYVPLLAKKYGAVPVEVMPETHSSSNTAQMNRVLRGMLKVAAVRIRKLKREGKSPAELRAVKQKALADAYRILVITMGEPPAKFSWRFEDKEGKLSAAKSYTPQSFWKEWVAETDLDGYVQLGNVPGQDYGKLYELSHSRDIYEAADIRYLNVPIEVLKTAALKSVLDKQPVWFASDVAKDQDLTHGILEVGVHDYAPIFGTPEKLTKAERWSYWDGAPNHAMVLMGVDVQDHKPVKWLVENSWGKEKGHEGYWSLYDNWFNEHLYMVVVKKNYVPEKILKQFSQKPVVLPRWHPMCSLSD